MKMDIDWEGLDKDKIKKALEFATERHKGQTRKSGGPYINHPVTVAEQVAILRHDTDTVCAALLHDTVEDTRATLEEIKDLFGEKVAFLVDGLSKDYSIEDKEERNEDYHRKLEEYGEEDERIWIIKFSDIFHNIQSIDAKGKKKARNYLEGVDKFYIPKAQKLGWKGIKKILDEEAEKLLKRITT